MSEEKKIIGANPEDEGRMLTATDILLGGEEGYKRIELQSVQKDGKPGVVYIKPLPARDVIRFADVPKEEQLEAMAPLIGKAVCDEEGSPVFTDVEARKLVDCSIAVFTELSTAVTGMMSGMTKETENVAEELGEDSSETPSSGSPIDSPTN